MDQLDINPRILTAVRRAKLNEYSSVLSLSGPDLERVTKLSARDVATLQKAVAEAVPRLPHTTGLELWQGKGPAALQLRRLSTGCPILDRFLRGGILSQGITEIAGESGGGKTQVCLQLCLTIQLPVSLHGLGSGAVYVCTEDAFPNKRLTQMVDRFVKSHSDQQAVREIKFTDNIFIEHAADMDDLRFCLTRKIPYLLEQGLVRLVIVDSIAALFRCEFGPQQAVQRAKELSSFGVQLRRLSQKYNIPVVCVNQVSDLISKSDAASGDDGGRRVIPALGLTWANLVTTRLMLSRTHTQVSLPSAAAAAVGAGPAAGQEADGAGRDPVIVRTMEVLFAPHLPNNKCQYIIDSDGVRGLPLVS